MEMVSITHSFPDKKTDNQKKKDTCLTGAEPKTESRTLASLLLYCGTLHTAISSIWAKSHSGV